MFIKATRLLVLLLLPTLAQLAMAEKRDLLESSLQQLNPGIEILELIQTPVPGFNEVLLNTGDLLYINDAGDYLFAGNLLALTDAGLQDLTEQSRAQRRGKMVQQLPAAEQVVFPAAGETRAVVQIFTDITCPYCVRLHEQVPELNRQGIEIRYLAFPRQGLQGQGYQQLVNVWCADNRRQAMNDAKSGKTVKSRQCDNPVQAQYDLGRSIGVQGTPAIILPDGRLIPGFVPADRLLSELGL